MKLQVYFCWIGFMTKIQYQNYGENSGELKEFPFALNQSKAIERSCRRSLMLKHCAMFNVSFFNSCSVMQNETLSNFAQYPSRVWTGQTCSDDWSQRVSHNFPRHIRYEISFIKLPSGLGRDPYAHKNIKMWVDGIKTVLYCCETSHY